MSEGVRTALRGIGQTLITGGMVILLFCLYELYFTGLYTASQQKDLRTALEQQWRTATPVTSQPPGAPTATVALAEPTNGDGIANIRIPRLGRDYVYTVVEGVDREDLKKGPGHEPDTAMPGGLGNFVISGHRTTYLAPFNRVDELADGDPIVVETKDTWYTYRVTGEQVVDPTAVEVTYPVPGKKGATPTEHLLTLTTCNPKYSARQRLIVRGTLESSAPKSDGLPSALLAAGS